jgi:hypothetical protein
MKAELAKSHCEISQSLLHHLDRRGFRSKAGIHHTQVADERAQEMEEWGRWTFVQNTAANGKPRVSSKSISGREVTLTLNSEVDEVFAKELLARGW